MVLRKVYKPDQENPGTEVHDTCCFRDTFLAFFYSKFKAVYASQIYPRYYSQRN